MALHPGSHKPRTRRSGGGVSSVAKGLKGTPRGRQRGRTVSTAARALKGPRKR